MTLLQRIEKLIDACFAHLPRPRPTIAGGANVSFVAHRGAHAKSLSIAENTDAAFLRALHLGCYGIELDVHACADGVLVVNHDATLTRIWNHPVKINTLSFDALRALAPSIPSLAEVVANYGKKMHLFVELKAPFTATQALANTLQPLTPIVDYHLISLDETVFPTLTALFPKQSMLLVPIFKNVNQLCQLSVQQYYGGVLGHYLMLTKRQINQLKEAHQIAGVGMIDSKFSLYRELNRGIPLLFSNNIEAILSYFQELR